MLRWLLAWLRTRRQTPPAAPRWRLDEHGTPIRDMEPADYERAPVHQPAPRPRRGYRIPERL